MLGLGLGIWPMWSGASGGGGAPALDLQFAAGTVDPRIFFSRNSTALYFDAAGVLQEAAANEPRLDHDPVTLEPLGLRIEGQGINRIVNNKMDGTVAGAPGVAPTNWILPPASIDGLDREILPVGAEDGINYLEIRFSGTSTAAGNLFFTPAGTTEIPASQGQTWTHATYVSLTAGDLTGISSADIRTGGRDGTGANVPGSNGITTFMPEAGALRTLQQINTFSFTDPAVAFVLPTMRFGYESGANVDFTIRIGLPKLEESPYPTSPIRTSGAPGVREADVANVLVEDFNFNPSQGMIVAQFRRDFATAVPASIWTLHDGTTANQIRQSYDSIGPGIPLQAVVGGAGQSEAIFGAPLLFQIAKSAAAYALDGTLAGSLDGSSETVGAPGDLPAGIVALELGSDPSGVAPLEGWIQSLTYHPFAPDPAELPTYSGA